MDLAVWLLLTCLFLVPLALILWDARDRKPGNEEHRYDRALVNWTKVLGFSTIALVGATGYSAYVLNVTDRTLRETLEASSRAWVVPRLVELAEPLKVGQPPSLLLYHGNVGKEPAILVRVFSEGRALHVREGLADVSPKFDAAKFVEALIEKAGFEKNPCVMAERESSVGVLYPEQSAENNTRAIPSFGAFEKSVLDAKAAIVVAKGCIIYKSFEKIRRSQFCFMYIQTISENRLPERRRWFQSCISGNEAS